MSPTDGVSRAGRVAGRRRLLASLGLLVLAALAPLAWYLLSPLVLDRPAPPEASVTELAGAAGVGTVVARGAFGEVDAIHRGEGEAVLARLPDGRYLLRFERFRVTNGPDLYVYLAGHPAPRSSAELHGIADLEVATLKGNIGEQSYLLPDGLDPAQFRSVVVYCKRFTTVFSTAELRPS